jgi:hypothetical protein
MKTITATFLALTLFPLSAWADAELTGTVLKVDKAENQIVVKTERGEETPGVNKSTKGIENAKKGTEVTIKFSEQDGQPKVTEIIPGR